jgi:hypothetical protein
MLSLSKLFVARTLLFATIIVLTVPGQQLNASLTSFAPSTRNFAVTCQPGLVFRCTPKGCFCVPAVR